MADKLRGRGQSISRPAFLFPSENPTVNCLGKKTSGKRRCGGAIVLDQSIVLVHILVYVRLDRQEQA